MFDFQIVISEMQRDMCKHVLAIHSPTAPAAASAASAADSAAATSPAHGKTSKNAGESPSLKLTTRGRTQGETRIGQQEICSDLQHYS
jgi:hypothetical protein